MSDHSFNPLMAQKYGINCAVLINNFIFWTRTNAAHENGSNNFFDDRYWVYGTPEYFAKYFNYLTPRQIKYALDKLVKENVLIKGNFNKKGYDRTSWYSLSDSILIELNLDRTCLKTASLLIRQNCLMDKTKLSNASDKIVRPIPDTKPDTKPDINTHTQSVELELFSEPEKQRIALMLKRKTKEHKKCHELYKQLPEEVKNNKSFEEIHDECVTYYATQNPPQMVSPQRLVSWINQEIKYHAKQPKSYSQPKGKNGDAMSRVVNKYLNQGGTYDQHGNTIDPFR